MKSMKKIKASGAGGCDHPPGSLEQDKLGRQAMSNWRMRLMGGWCDELARQDHEITERVFAAMEARFSSPAGPSALLDAST